MLIKVPEGQDLEYAGEGTLKEILVELDKDVLKKHIAARSGDVQVDFHTRFTLNNLAGPIAVSRDAAVARGGFHPLRGSARFGHFG